MTLPAGNPTGRPPKLTTAQQAEVYATLGRERAVTLAARYGVRPGAIYAAWHRERRRRRA